jgi:hypothetical protein
MVHDSSRAQASANPCSLSTAVTGSTSLPRMLALLKRVGLPAALVADHPGLALCSGGRLARLDDTPHLAAMLGAKVVGHVFDVSHRPSIAGTRERTIGLLRRVS